MITAIGENAALVLQLGADLVLAIADAITQGANDGSLASAAESLVYGMWDAAVAAASALGQAIWNAILDGSLIERTPDMGPGGRSAGGGSFGSGSSSSSSSSKSKKKYGSNPSSFNPGSASPQSNGMPSTIFQNTYNFNAPKATPGEMLSEAKRADAWAAMNF